MSAAAANPNTSPLDFFLNVIRDKSLLLETRIAAAREALPYFHSKPQDSLPRQATPGRYGNASSGGNGGWAGGRSINIKITKGGSEAPESESEAELTPLGFLLGVMRAADTPPHLRLQVASLVARYLHPKRGGDGPPKIVVEDPTSFSIDPELAMEFRDAKLRYDIVCRGRNSHPEDYEREAPDLEIRIAELESSLQCPFPSMYSKKQYDRDQERLKELARVRHSGLKLSRQEDVEEAWLTARVAAWWTTPQAAAYERMFQLDLRSGRLVNDGETTLLYFASVLDCRSCPLRARCCPKMPARRIPRSIYEEARDVARGLAKTKAFEQSRRYRKKIEMLFAHLKRILRLGRLRLRGPAGAQFEFTLAAIAQNLRRLAKLIARPPPIAPTACVA